MENEWLINLQKNIESIMGKIPEIISPSVTYIAGVPFIGCDEFAVLIASYYANNINSEVLIFTFDYDEFVEYCKLDIEKINLESKNLKFLEAIDESYIDIAFEKYTNPKMLIFINPLRLQRQDFFEGYLYCEDIYSMICKIYNKYKIPVLIVEDIENKSITLRRDHIPVLYDVSNWHVTQDYFDNIILLHRDDYYYGMKGSEMMFIVEKSIKVKYDWFKNLQNKSGRIIEKIPEFSLPGIIYLTSALYMGADEFAILLGLYFADIDNKKVTVFIVENDRFNPLNNEELISKCKESNNLNVFYVSCEFDVNKSLKITHGLDMIIFICPDMLGSNYPIQNDIYYDDFYKMIDDILSEYKIPIIITGRLSPVIICKRKNHIPVLCDIPNWNLIQNFFHTIIFLHRDGYFNAQLDGSSTTFIVEKSPTIGRRKFMM